MGIDPLGLLEASWIREPVLNITNKNIFDRVGLTKPYWLWWGYIKFIRVYGNLTGYINIDVKCKDECREWEIHEKEPFSLQGHVDIGPNLYALGAGVATRKPSIGIGANVLLASGSLLELEASLLRKASPLLSTVKQNGPLAICKGKGI